MSMKKKLLFIIIIIFLCFSALNYIYSVSQGLCRNFIEISNNHENILMLLNKLTFFRERPDYLKRFESIEKYPNISTRYFSDLHFSLGINWESLGIYRRKATFSFQGKRNKPSLNYGSSPLL
ncbi:MAG: hypothetical protein GY781_15605 [Gammaproteobacteria bacterium]|nr:hypothetical protein [Gammaproteobacteria bacterium]